MITYLPSKRATPCLAHPFNSAWGNIPTILLDIIEKFNVRQEIALEFGVEYGYSTSALANYFKTVIGVDIFEGGSYRLTEEEHLEKTKKNLEGFNNIQLVKSSFQKFIKDNDCQYDLIHIDIIHEYNDTFACGDWAVQHAPITLFHDTISYSDVMRAVTTLAKIHNLDFYNYEEWHGLGILVRNKISQPVIL